MHRHPRAPAEAPLALAVDHRAAGDLDGTGLRRLAGFARLQLDLGNDRHFLFAGAATSDGDWLIGASQPKEFRVEVPVTWGRSDAVLVRVSDGSVREMAKLTSPMSQLLFAASDGPWVVWMEASDEPNFSDWRIRDYNLDTGATTELAHALHKTAPC